MDGTNLDHLPPGVDMKNWQMPENLRWSFQHIADFLPTAVISRGQGLAVALPAAYRDLDSITVPGTEPDLPDVTELGVGPDSSVRSVMGSTDTDGWMVLHRGRVLAESYFGEMGPDTSHLLMSVSKSLIGAVAGALSDAGVLCPEKQLTAYLPELADTGYAGATVRDLLDMRSGIAFSENYLDPFAEVRMLEEAIGWAPPAAPDPPACTRT